MEQKIEPGWKFTPLYDRCPRCNCDLTKQFIDAPTNNNESDKNEGYSYGSVIARMSSYLALRVTKHQRCLQRMINPFPKPDEKATNGDGRSCSGWKFWQVTGTNKCENNNANNHDNLVPVVKRKLRERIIHYFLGRDSF